MATGDGKVVYAGSATAITITLASLTDTSWRQSASVSNTSNLYVDALVAGKITTGSGSGTGDYVDLYVAYSLDGGTKFSGDATGSDAAYTGESLNLIFLDRIWTPTASTTHEFTARRTVAGVCGFMPPIWAVVVDNESDSTLNATGSNHAIEYHGGYYNVEPA